MALSDMTFSTVDVDFVKSYLRIDEEFADDDIEIQLFLDVARSWVLEHTGMTEEQLDKIHFSTILLLKYTADFYNDTYLTDQNACTSPKLVIWLGNNKLEAKKIFWDNLHELVKKKYTVQPVQAGVPALHRLPDGGRGVRDAADRDRKRQRRRAALQRRAAEVCGLHGGLRGGPRRRRAG